MLVGICCCDSSSDVYCVSKLVYNPYGGTVVCAHGCISVAAHLLQGRCVVTGDGYRIITVLHRYKPPEIEDSGIRTSSPLLAVRSLGKSSSSSGSLRRHLPSAAATATTATNISTSATGVSTPMMDAPLQYQSPSNSTTSSPTAPKNLYFGVHNASSPPLIGV